MYIIYFISSYIWYVSRTHRIHLFVFFARCWQSSAINILLSFAQPHSYKAPKYTYTTTDCWKLNAGTYTITYTQSIFFVVAFSFARANTLLPCKAQTSSVFSIVCGTSVVTHKQKKHATICWSKRTRAVFRHSVRLSWVIFFFFGSVGFPLIEDFLFLLWCWFFFWFFFCNWKLKRTICVRFRLVKGLTIGGNFSGKVDLWHFYCVSNKVAKIFPTNIFHCSGFFLPFFFLLCWFR